MSGQPRAAWTAERVAKLADEELRNLRANALAGGNGEIVALCDAELERRAASRAQARAAQAGASRAGTKRAALAIPERAIALLAAKFAALPRVEDMGNGRDRLRRQAAPLATLAQLWWQFIVCGFSSQENSEESGALAQFVRAGGPLLDLAMVHAHAHDGQLDAAWVEREVRRYPLRLWPKKVRLVLGAYAAFARAGIDKDFPAAALADERLAGGPLKLFCALARGTMDDRDLARSGEFSARIDASPFPEIGHKQIRNILVNAGLAHNVVPLDSRWQAYFGDVLRADAATFSIKGRYLAIEDLLRRALLVARETRPDLANLSVLDAVVFAHMSKEGIGEQGWLG